jgi:hypothetical protein
MNDMFTAGSEAMDRKSALNPLTEEPDPEMVPDWSNIGIFATGLALGVVLGATAALFSAPESGRDLRHRVAARFGRGQSDDSVWDQLGEELVQARSKLAKAIDPDD